MDGLYNSNLYNWLLNFNHIYENAKILDNTTSGFYSIPFLFRPHLIRVRFNFIKLQHRKKKTQFAYLRPCHNGTTTIVLSQLKLAQKKGYNDKLSI